MFAKKTMQTVSSYTVLFGRLVVALPVLFLLVFICENGNFTIPNNQTLIYLLITGIFVQAISKVMWYESLNRMRIVTATAIGMTFPVFTMLFSYLLENTLPSFWQIAGFGVCTIGVLIAYRGELKLNNIEQTETELI
jgi:drug/metabolite transporter (DMT)-like permease